MNISPWLVYFFIKLDALINLGIVFSCITGAITVIYLAMLAIMWDQNHYDPESAEAKSMKKKIKIWTAVVISLIIATTLIPSTKQMAAIYVIPKIANSELVNQTIPNEMGEIYNMAKEWMRSTVVDKSDKVEKK